MSSPKAKDIKLLISPNKVLEPDTSEPPAFDRDPARKLMMEQHPEADLNTIEEILALYFYQKDKNIPLPEDDNDLVQQIDDLRNKDLDVDASPKVRTVAIPCCPPDEV